MADWKRCSICKKGLAFGSSYYLCSVSTCQRPRLRLYFCSLSCFDAHLPEARHRDAWAEQETAPSEEQAEEAAAAAKERRPPAAQNARRVVQGAASSPPPRDTLVVLSKLKAFIRAQAGMNTSDGVAGVVSDHLRDLSVAALRVAAEEGRKTVLDRDFAEALKRVRGR